MKNSVAKYVILVCRKLTLQYHPAGDSLNSLPCTKGEITSLDNCHPGEKILPNTRISDNI